MVQVLILSLKRQHKEASTLFVGILMIDNWSRGAGYWLWLVLYVAFSALTLLVGCHNFHLVHAACASVQ